MKHETKVAFETKKIMSGINKKEKSTKIDEIKIEPSDVAYETLFDAQDEKL